MSPLRLGRSLDVIFSGQNLPPKKQKNISLHDVLEPLKQALLASRDVAISSQTCTSKLQRVFTLGDGCWLPTRGPKMLLLSRFGVQRSPEGSLWSHLGEAPKVIFFHWVTKGRFQKRVVLANVPSFRSSFWGNIQMYPRSGFRSGGTSECTPVPLFVPSEHPPKPPFWKTTLLSSHFLVTFVRERKHININKFAGLSWDWVGGNLFFSGHSLWGREKNKLNPPKNKLNPPPPNPRTIP